MLLLANLKAIPTFAWPFTILDARLPPAGKREIILTFDDGPEAKGEVSSNILDVLSRQQVTAVFFFVGKRAQASPELVLRAATEGHQLGIHGWESGWPVWSELDALREEVAMARRAIERATDTPMAEPLFYRPPRGIVTPAVGALEDRCEIRLGRLTFYTRDSAAESPEEAAAVMQATREGLLAHDGGAIVFHSSRYREDPGEDDSVDKRWLPAAIEELITWARSEGFTFTTYPRESLQRCESKR